VPTYDGIQHLREKGDVFQYGGPRLCEGGVFPMPTEEPPALRSFHSRTRHLGRAVLLSTRRGKQFNSMIQAKSIRSRRGSPDVLMAQEDAAVLSFKRATRSDLSNDSVRTGDALRFAPIRPRNIQIYWPEGNVLIRRGIVDPSCEMPDYNALVRIEPVPGPRCDDERDRDRRRSRTCGRCAPPIRVRSRTASPRRNRMEIRVESGREGSTNERPPSP